jgi:DNA polymerase-3 subunit epsilon
MTAADNEKWQTMPLLGFDLETTGVDAHVDRVVTATIVEHNPGKRPSVSNWIVDPQIPIPDGAAAIHGWTTERLKACPDVRTPAQALYEISGRIAVWMGRRFPIVVMNAAYDVTMLEAENVRYGLPTLVERLSPKPVGPVIDPGVLDKHAEQRRPGKRNLTALCEHYGVPLIAAHTSESDAISAVRLARAIIARHPELVRGMTIGGLHQAQRTWRREQVLSLKSYHERVGRASGTYDPAWPVMSTPVPVAPEPETALL